MFSTSVAKDCMKCPSLQSCRLSRPTNQSGEGTIFVIADTWRKHGSKSKKASKGAALHLGGQLETFGCVYPKRTLQSDFPKPTKPLDLPPSLPLPLLASQIGGGTRVSVGQGGRVFMQMWAGAKTAPGVVLSR